MERAQMSHECRLRLPESCDFSAAEAGTSLENDSVEERAKGHVVVGHGVEDGPLGLRFWLYGGRARAASCLRSFSGRLSLRHGVLKQFK